MTMVKMTVAKAKKKIIAQIKRKGGLFENCGQKELRELDNMSNECWELNQWIESLDYQTVQQYL